MQYIESPKTETSGLLQVTSSEIEAIIKSLNKVGGGIDLITTQILLGTYKNIIDDLTFFFNLCLRSAVFPLNMKIAIITPIHKCGKRDRFNNYRPISILPMLSKILEKIIHSKLSLYLEENCILNAMQFGFRKNYSTYMPIAHMYDEITSNLQNNEKTAVLYLDLKKAFDTVSIDILLKKIHLYGIRGRLYEIITSYVKNRYQITKVNDIVSEKNEVHTGVPQGSILGPLLFILYINDIPNATDLGKFYVFADDTAVLFKADTVDNLQSNINEAMPQITQWFQVNRLSLNASKSNYQIFSRNRVVSFQVMLQNVFIERKSCVRYLGMYIDENLKWYSHIAHVASKVSRNIGVIGRTKFFLSSRELLLLYNALIYPYLSYCAVIWGNNYDTNIQRIILLQKRAIRIISKKSYLHPTNELFIEHKI